MCYRSDKGTNVGMADSAENFCFFAKRFSSLCQRRAVEQTTRSKVKNIGGLGCLDRHGLTTIGSPTMQMFGQGKRFSDILLFVLPMPGPRKTLAL